MSCRGLVTIDTPNPAPTHTPHTAELQSQFMSHSQLEWTEHCYLTETGSILDIASSRKATITWMMKEIINNYHELNNQYNHIHKSV